jgi:hypothetical protein
MADEKDQQTRTGDDAPASPAIDPREVEALRQFANTVGPFYEKVSPYIEDVEKFVSDENFRNVSKQAWNAYEAASKTQEPEVPAYVKELKDGQSKLVAYVDELKNQTAIQNASRQIETLAQTYPDLAAENYKLLGELQADAKEVGISTMDGFVKYLQKNAPRYFKAVEAEPERKTPPRSSRPDGGLPGVPEPKVPTFSAGRKGIAERKAFIRSQFQKAAGGR